jgi:hypothetical protein
VEDGPPVHRDRFVGVVGEHERRMVVRRLLTLGICCNVCRRATKRGSTEVSGRRVSG